ncbi:MAG: hypothetical protein V3V81_07985 [Candidatus Bathyarchaeia archaeon]
MQNWKIKRMSYQELIGQSKAVGSLLYYYKKGKTYPEDCPLCKVGWTHHPTVENTCDYCLWIIITGENCCNFSDRDFKKNAADVSHLPRWHKLRIPMLKRWKKILQAEKDSRTEGGGT